MQRSGGDAGFGNVARKFARGAAFAILCATLANCSSAKFTGKTDSKWGVSASARVADPDAPIPKGGGTYRVGKPYTIAGKTYTPEENVNYRAEGLASWYGDDFHGRLTANGEIYDMQSLTAAHPTLPIPSYVRVTNLANKRSVVVRVNDRGPYVGNRIIDLSSKTAKLLGFHNDGVAKVRVEYIGRAPLEGSDDRKLMATLREGGERTPAPSPVRVADAKPFVPEYFDSTPVAKRTAAVDSVARPLAPPPAKGAPAAVPGGPAGAKTPPVSAFAPVRYDNAAGFMSGRGLY